MPLDLSAVNAMIEGYTRGHNAKLEDENFQEAKKQFQDQMNQAKKFHEDTLKFQTEQEHARLDMLKLQLGNQIAQQHRQNLQAGLEEPSQEAYSNFQLPQTPTQRMDVTPDPHMTPFAIQPNATGANAFQVSSPIAVPPPARLQSYAAPVPKGFEDLIPESMRMVNPNAPQDALARKVAEVKAMIPLQAEATRATEQAKQETDLPFLKTMKDLEHQNKLGEIGAQGDIQKDIAKTRGQNALDVANIHAAVSRDVANIHAGAQTEAARIAHDAGLDANEINGAIQNTILHGDPFLKALPSKLRPKVTEALDRLGLKVKSKEDIAFQDSLPGIENLIGQYAEMAKKYSATGTLSALYNKAQQKAGIVPSDLRAALQGIKGQAGVTARTFDKQTGRIGDAETIREIDSVFDPTLTYDENMSNLMRKISFVDAEIRNQRSKYGDKDINGTLASKGIRLFGNTTGEIQDIPGVTQNPNEKLWPKTNKKGQTLNLEESRKTGTPHYE